MQVIDAIDRERGRPILAVLLPGNIEVLDKASWPRPPNRFEKLPPVIFDGLRQGRVMKARIDTQPQRLLQRESAAECGCEVDDLRLGRTGCLQQNIACGHIHMKDPHTGHSIKPRNGRAQADDYLVIGQFMCPLRKALAAMLHGDGQCPMVARKHSGNRCCTLAQVIEKGELAREVVLVLECLGEGLVHHPNEPIIDWPP